MGKFWQVPERVSVYELRTNVSEHSMNYRNIVLITDSDTDGLFSVTGNCYKDGDGDVVPKFKLVIDGIHAKIEGVEPRFKQGYNTGMDYIVENKIDLSKLEYADIEGEYEAGEDVREIEAEGAGKEFVEKTIEEWLTPKYLNAKNKKSRYFWQKFQCDEISKEKFEEVSKLTCRDLSIILRS